METTKNENLKSPGSEAPAGKIENGNNGSTMKIVVRVMKGIGLAIIYLVLAFVIFVAVLFGSCYLIMRSG
jgi:hypothetical protein